MSDLPPGFVLDGPPQGFVLDQQQPRGVMDQLLGLTGPRYQTWPEKAMRGIAAIPQQTMQAAASAPPGSSELTANLVPHTTEAAAAFGPMAPRVGASFGKASLPTIEQLLAEGGAGFDALRKLDVDIKPESVVNSFGGFRANLERDGINAELAPKTFSVLDSLGKIPKKAPGDLSDPFISVNSLETLRRTLGNAGKDFANPTEQLAARRAGEHLKSYLADVPAGDVLRGDAGQISKVLGEATGNYAAGKRAGQISDAVSAADLSAAAANSGRNIGNAERQKFKSLLLSDKQSAGFNAEELAQVEKIVRGTTTGNTLRHVGNFLGGGGGMGQAVTTAMGALAGGAAGGGLGAAAGAAAVPVLGNMARSASNASTQRQVRLLDEMVRSRSPMAQGMAVAPEGPSRIPPAILARLLLEAQQQQ